MKRNTKKNIAVILIIIVSIVLCALLIKSYDMKKPADDFAETIAEITPASSLSEKINPGNKSQNDNLENKITEKEKQKEEKKQKEENKKQENQNPENQNTKPEKKPESRPQEQGNQGPGEEPANPEDDIYKDLAEDAYVEENIPINDLMNELGIRNKDQIIYAKSVTADGKSTILNMVNDVYSVFLSTQGATIIQITYEDDNGEVQTYNKKINYKRPEGTTPEKKRPIVNTTLKNEGIYSNSTLNFDVWVTNYRGRPLAYSNMEVYINGEKADYVGEMDRQTYNAHLNVGANTIKIKVTDMYQYTVTKLYTVYYKSGKATITISVEAGTVGIPYVIEPRKMEVSSGTPLAAVIDELLKTSGYGYSCTGTIEKEFYLQRISKRGMLKGYKIPSGLISKLEEDGINFSPDGYNDLDSLGEHDFSQGSGWMYSINGLYPTQGFSKNYVENGDVVRIRYTLAYGKDIGGASKNVTVDGLLKDYGREW